MSGSLRDVVDVIFVVVVYRFRLSLSLLDLVGGFLVIACICKILAWEKMTTLEKHMVVEARSGHSCTNTHGPSNP